VRPVLKSVAWERVDRRLRVGYDLRDQFIIGDPDGTVESLLGLLREGGRTVSELATALRVPADDVMAAVRLLDEHGLVEDGDPLRALPLEVRERHFSNLAFFESFASLARARADFCRTLWNSHVLVLGTGGLNSNVVPHLAGLGIGRLTLLDCDVVEPRNFARQYLYRRGPTVSRASPRSLPTPAVPPVAAIATDGPCVDASSNASSSASAAARPVNPATAGGSCAGSGVWAGPAAGAARAPAGRASVSAAPGGRSSGSRRRIAWCRRCSSAPGSRPSWSASRSRPRWNAASASLACPAR
jgi:hypothetical protein